jgi:hypothetical protein
MKCVRCEGLMVPDRFIDLEETGHLWMSGCRCMNCGHVADAVTEQNRKLQAQGLVAVVTGEAKAQDISDMPSRVPSRGISRSTERKSPANSMTDNHTQAA